MDAGRIMESDMVKFPVGCPVYWDESWNDGFVEDGVMHSCKHGHAISDDGESPMVAVAESSYGEQTISFKEREALSAHRPPPMDEKCEIHP